MKKTYLYIVGCLLIIGVISAPYFVKKNFMKEIVSTKEMLQSHGVELTITKTQGYLENLISFDAKIVNGKKFRNYILDEINKDNPDFAVYFKIIKNKSNPIIDKILNGTKFDGTIQSSNLFIGNTKIKISLVKFSKDISRSIKKDKIVTQNINLLLDKKLITLFVELNSNRKVTLVKIQDIDRVFDLKHNETLNIKYIGNKLKIKNQKHRTIATYTFDNEMMEANGKNKSIFIQAKGFNYGVNYLGQFDYVSSMHLDNLDFNAKNYSKTTVFKFKNLDAKSSISLDKEDALIIDVNYALSDIYIKNRAKELNLGKVKLSIEITNIQKNNLLHLSQTYNKIAFAGKRLSSQDVQNLIKSYTKIINDGFNINWTLSIEKLNVKKTKLSNIDINFQSKLAPNTVSKNNFAKLIKAFSVTGTIAMSENDLKVLSSLDKNKKFTKFTKFAKKEADKVTFDLKFEKGKLSINGNKI